MKRWWGPPAAIFIALSVGMLGLHWWIKHDATFALELLHLYNVVIWLVATWRIGAWADARKRPHPS